MANQMASSRKTTPTCHRTIMSGASKAVTITFGEVAENHAGMQKIGTLAENGFDFNDLLHAQTWFESRGSCCTLVALHTALPEGDGQAAVAPSEHAWILVAHQALDALKIDADSLLKEHVHLPVDKKALMRGRVVNKHARYNLCYANAAQTPDYVSGKGRIVSFDQVPLLSSIRNSLPDIVGDKGTDLNCELNLYYDPRSTGIGFHGDSERKRVVAIRLGASIPLHYQWFYRSTPIGRRVQLTLEHGDMYIMSEKASGYDWHRSSIRTLRHAAGADKYLQTKVPPQGPPLPPLVIMCCNQTTERLATNKNAFGSSRIVCSKTSSSSSDRDSSSCQLTNDLTLDSDDTADDGTQGGDHVTENEQQQGSKKRQRLVYY
jgi:alkylated DNA repair dioxygenase AlkB